MVSVTINPDIPLVVSYGGGTNSCAMLCGFRERGIRPDYILFADTKGELPHTYEHINEMSKRTLEWWGVPIIVVFKTYQGRHEGLEQECLRRRQLPALAYGRKACSHKHKIEPQEKALRKWMDASQTLRVRRAIGFDVNESHRMKKAAEHDLRKGRTVTNWYPLTEWGWGRPECNVAILRNGITLPGKSACFFCPSMKRHEILALKQNHRDYFDRAIRIEQNAIITSEGRGLGGSSLRWQDVDANDEAQTKLWDWVDEHAATRVPCGCIE